MPSIAVSVSPSAFRHSAPAFTLSDLSAKTLNWYKWDVVATSGANVTGWADQGPLNRDLTPTGGVTYALSGGANDLPYIQFNGSTGYLRRAYTQSQTEHVFLVCRPQAAAAANETLIDGGALVNTRRIYTVSTSNLGMFAGAGPIQVASGGHANWMLIEAKFAGASSSIRVNNGTAVTGDVGTGPSGGLTIGAHGGLAQFIDMRIAELFIGNGSLTTDEITAIRNLMNAEYQLW